MADQSGMSSMCKEAKTGGSAQPLCTTATLLMDSQMAAQSSISCHSRVPS